MSERARRWYDAYLRELIASGCWLAAKRAADEEVGRDPE